MSRDQSILLLKKSGRAGTSSAPLMFLLFISPNKQAEIGLMICRTLSHSLRGKHLGEFTQKFTSRFARFVLANGLPC